MTSVFATARVNVCALILARFACAHLGAGDASYFFVIFVILKNFAPQAVIPSIDGLEAIHGKAASQPHA